MMKKTTSALAVAALLGTGAATAATFQVNDNTSLSLSGDIQMVYQDREATQDRETTDSSIFDNGSSLVFSGEHTSNGVTTFFNLDHDSFDTAFDAVGTTGDGDEGHIGVRGDFGDIRFGKESAAYETLDGLFDYQWDLNTTSVSPGDKARVLQYRGPAIGNVSYVLESQINGEAEKVADGNQISLAAAGSVDLGVVSLTAAYDQRANNGTASKVDEALYGLAASFDIQDIAVDVGYQKDGDSSNEADIISVSGKYYTGPVGLYGVYQAVSYDNAPIVDDEGDSLRDSLKTTATDDSFNEFIVGASYSVNDALTVAAEYLDFGNDDDEGDTVSLVGYYGF